MREFPIKIPSILALLFDQSILSKLNLTTHHSFSANHPSIPFPPLLLIPHPSAADCWQSPKMFPWFPFFVYPEAASSNDSKKRRRRKNCPEEIMEVHAIGTETTINRKRATELNEPKMTQLQIEWHLKPMATSLRMRLNKGIEEREEKAAKSQRGSKYEEENDERKEEIAAPELVGKAFENSEKNNQEKQGLEDGKITGPEYVTEEEDTSSEEPASNVAKTMALFTAGLAAAAVTGAMTMAAAGSAATALTLAGGTAVATGLTGTMTAITAAATGAATATAAIGRVKECQEVPTIIMEEASTAYQMAQGEMATLATNGGETTEAALPEGIEEKSTTDVTIICRIVPTESTVSTNRIAVETEEVSTTVEPMAKLDGSNENTENDHQQQKNEAEKENINGIRRDDKMVQNEVDEPSHTIPSSSSSSELLPKAPTEHLHVEFGGQQDGKQMQIFEPMNTEMGQMARGEKPMEDAVEMPSSAIGEKMVPKSTRCSATASTSSNSSSTGQLAVRKSSNRNRRDKSGGSRSGASSAKQSPCPTHSSTDSLASIHKQLERFGATVAASSTPPPPRRRKSAFETSQAMRELFGRTEESPFAGVEEQRRKRSKRMEDEERKDEIVPMERKAEGGANAQQKGMKENNDENNDDDERIKKRSRNNSAAVDGDEHLTARLIPQLDIPIIPDAVAAAATSQDAPSSDPDLAISSKTQDGQQMEMSAGMEAKVQLKCLKDEEKKKDEDEEERIQQRGPAKQVEEKQQRNGQQQQNRPRSVARVAPFAYFPPEEQQTTAAAGAPQIASGRRRQLGTTAEVFDNGNRDGTIIAIVNQSGEEGDEEVLKRPALQQPNGTKDQANCQANWPEEIQKEEEGEREREEDYQKQKRTTVHWGEKSRREGAVELANGHLTNCASGEDHKAKEAGRGPIPIDPKQQEKRGSSREGLLPGDHRRNQRQQQQNNPKGGGGGISPRRGTNGIGTGGGGGGGGVGQQPPAKQKHQTTMVAGRNGTGSATNGGREDSTTGSRGRSNTSTSLGGGGGGGGGGGAIPPSTLKMVNDSGAGANGTSSGGAGIVPQLLIRNTIVVNDDDFFMADILIEEGLIREVSQEPVKNVGPQCEQIDADGRCLLPAGIDILPTGLLANNKQVAAQSNMPADALARATKAALCGGTGTLIDVFCPRADEVGDAIQAGVNRIRGQIENVAECNVGLSAAIMGKWRSEQSRMEMTRLVENCGVNSFLLDLPSDSDLLEALEHSRMLGTICRVSTEDKQMIGILERKMRDQHISQEGRELADKLNAQHIQHLCTLAELANAPMALVPMVSTTAAAHPAFPPKGIVWAEVPVGIQQQRSSSELIELLANRANTICVSDQSTAAAIEHRMATLWEGAVLARGQMDPMKFVAATSANAARIFNLYPRKGRIAVGSDADLVLWDLPLPGAPGGASSNSPSARPQLVIMGGRIRLRQGLFVSVANESPKLDRMRSQQRTMFLPLAPNSPHLFGLVRLREGSFNFADFARPQQNTPGSPSRTGSLQSTRTGTPDEPIGAAGNGSGSNTMTTAATTAAARPGSRNRNIQSDQPASRATTKVIQPPGGKSTSFW